MKPGDDFDVIAARVDQTDRLPADAVRQPDRGGTGPVGQSHQIGLVVDAESETPEPGHRAPPDDHARPAGVGPPQVQFLRGDGRGLEPERAGEGGGPGQVRFVELQPGQVGDLDHRIDGTAGVITGHRPLLAVQLVMRTDDVAHGPSFLLVDEIVTYDVTISQGSVRRG